MRSRLVDADENTAKNENKFSHSCATFRFVSTHILYFNTIKLSYIEAIIKNVYARDKIFSKYIRIGGEHHTQLVQMKIHDMTDRYSDDFNSTKSTSRSKLSKVFCESGRDNFPSFAIISSG